MKVKLKEAITFLSNGGEKLNEIGILSLFKLLFKRVGIGLTRISVSFC